MRTLILILVTAIVLSCGAVSAQCAPTNIPLTTPAGVCTFIADSYTTVPPSAKGNFGPGCPGYVPPGGGGDPVVCSANPGVRLPSVKATWNGSGLPATTANALKWSTLLGYDPNNKIEHEFPVGTTYLVSMPAGLGTYIGMEFTTATNFSPTAAGSFSVSQTGMTGIADMSLSQCPGDFTGGGNRFCKGTKGEGAMFAWGPGLTSCPIKPGAKYYLNIRSTPVTDGGSCAAGVACKVSAKADYSHP